MYPLAFYPVPNLAHRSEYMRSGQDHHANGDNIDLSWYGEHLGPLLYHNRAARSATDRLHLAGFHNVVISGT